jgi:diguanylate cyclase (GGDEF)-like protein
VADVTDSVATKRSGSLARRLLLVAVLVALGAMSAHAVLGFGGAAIDAFFVDKLYIGLETLGVLLCAARAVRVRELRPAWTCIAAAFACWTVGDVLWIVLPELGYPSIADAFYLVFYPLCLAGMALLLADGRNRIATRLWIDGVIAALATAGLVVALFFDAIVSGTQGTPAQTAVNLAYPLLDLLLIGFVLTAFAAQAWRPDRGWVLLGLGAMLSAAADTIYLYQDALGTFREGSLVDVLWAAAVLACGWAAWQEWRPAAATAHRYSRQTFALPAGFAILALSLLAYGQVVPLSHVAGLLATLALTLATLRAGWTYRENLRLLHAMQEEALTDGLTGLPNRRRLMHDLDRTVAAGERGEASTFAFFDLDGFKGYNDTFGHAAGDMLLDRLAGRLAATVASRGRAYRLGGDEFCVLVDGRLKPNETVLEDCGEALSEQGEGFRVGASCGAVSIPDEAESATHALHLADQRMYAAKDGRRSSSRGQMRDMLLQVLREREPELHQHLRGVSALAVAVGRRLELNAEQLDEVARAAELHDVGKIAVPDEILHKPGPLDDDEWELMRQHTIIGDRILAAAPAMRPVAAIVRASHERFDGDGYPDRLAGEEIPLGARIVAVCDAYHAMTSLRPYQAIVGQETALAELERCAGSQFDPAVVAAFAALVRSPTAEVEVEVDVGPEALQSSQG